jgi:cobalt-zinc-cadmium resistance protein CzcA
VVIGGLISATLLTLLILPVLYSFTWKRPASAGKIIAGLALLILVCKPLQAQQILNFDQAYSLGLKNSYEGKAFFHESGAAGMLARSGSAWTKTSIQTQSGQYNSQLQDQNYSISQNFPLPAVFKNQKRFNQTQYRSAKLDELQFKADFWLAMRIEFENLHHSRKMQQLLSGMDSLSAKEVEMAELRLRAGETGKLELALARRQEAELRLRKFQTETDEKAAVQQISLLVRDSLAALFEVNPWNLSLISGARFSDSSLSIKKALALAEAESARLALEKSTRLPEFMVGYFNQSLNGIPIDGRQAGNRDRFQGLNLGIQVPLLPASARNRVEAAGERVKAAGARVMAEKNKGDRIVQELDFRINSEKSRLEMLEGNSLNAVREVYDAAMEQWKAGNAGFQEVLIQRKSLLQLQEEILLVQHKVSLLGIELYYLTNEKWN